jgi:hypothetical protein
LKEGDRQNPEGFYAVGRRQLHRIGRWPRSLNVGYPNAYDRANGRTGSYILVHGGCSSVGCFAMTNAVMDEVFALVEAALRKGQANIDLHVFPFRMSEANLASHAGSSWIGFWRDLKQGYDAFESTRIPPRIGLCDKRYVVEAVHEGDETVRKPTVLGRRFSRRARSPQLPDACDWAEPVATAAGNTAGTATSSLTTGSNEDAEASTVLQPLAARSHEAGHSRTAAARTPSRAPHLRRSGTPYRGTSSLPLVFGDQIKQ